MNAARRAAAREVRVEARAKLNLGLAVGPRREDGFHDLVTVFQSISLADTLVVRPRTRGFRLRVRFEDASFGAAKRKSLPRTESVSEGDDNLVMRAARLFHEVSGRGGGADFTLVKRIPAQSGLGGGSADAAATIAALARLHGWRAPLERRLELAARLGSDVPFAMFGGTALGRGRGERLARLRLATPFRALVAVPTWGVSTREAFARIDRDKYGLTSWSAKIRFANEMERRAVDVLRALRMGNTFEDVLGRRRAEFDSLRSRFESAGASAVRMTGSGSAVFAVVPHGSPIRLVAGRFKGDETLFAVRSVASGMRLQTRSVLEPEARKRAVPE